MHRRIKFENNRELHYLLEAYALDPDAIEDALSANDGYVLVNKCRNLLKKLITRNPSLFPSIMRGQLPQGYATTVELPNNEKLLVGIIYEYSINGIDSAMFYDSDRNMIVFCVKAMLASANCNITEADSDNDINHAMANVIDKVFATEYRDIRDSFSEFIVHENRHRLDARRNIKFNDNDEYSREMFDEAKLSSGWKDDDMPESKAFAHDMEITRNIVQPLELRTDLSDRVKRYFHDNGFKILRKLLKTEMYTKNLPDFVINELEYCKSQFDIDDMIAIERPELVQRFIHDYRALCDLYNVKSLTEDELRSFVAKDRMRAKVAKQKQDYLLMMVYHNQATEVNSYITQKIPKIAMLKKSNLEHIDVDAEVERLYKEIGGDFLIADIGTKTKNRLYTLVVAADRIKLSRNVYSTLSRMYAMYDELKKMFNK